MELHIRTSTLFRFIRLALVINTFRQTADAKGVQLETQNDKMIKTEFNYMDWEGASLLQCAARCAGDRRCMSASYNDIHWSCHFSMHRINGADDQRKLDEGTSGTAMMKKGYLDGWTLIGETFYFILAETKNYYDAKSYCEREGGNLAEPKTSDQNVILRNFMEEIHAASGWYWIGLNDIEEEGRFVWASDGLELDYSGWIEHEPTNLGNEDCTVVQTGSGKWNDVACHGEYGAICELN